MKNLLIATTALVATASVAAAEVSLSGYARFGATYNDGVASGADKTNTASRLRLQFDATTETDGGLTLGARMRSQSEENAAGTWNQARFFVTTGGLTVGMGNILGVLDAAPMMYLPTKSAGVGLEGDSSSPAANFATPDAALSALEAAVLEELELEELPAGVSLGITAAPLYTAYSSGGKLGGTDGVEVLYNMSGLGLHAHSTDETYGLGANYAFGDIKVAVAYEEYTKRGATKGSNILFASVGGKFGAFDAAVSYAKGDFKGTTITATAAGETETVFDGIDWEAEKITLKGGYTASDALYVYGFVAMEDNTIPGAAEEGINVSVDESFGLGASYALGGGASVEGGWTQNAAGDNIVSAGLFFSF